MKTSIQQNPFLKLYKQDHNILKKNLIKKKSKRLIKELYVHNYNNFSKHWCKLQFDWLSGNYKSFKDIDIYLILVYLFYQELSFFNRSNINQSYDDIFLRKKNIEFRNIQKTQISKFLRIPEETVRRKISKLFNLKILASDKNSNQFLLEGIKIFKPNQTLANLSKLLYEVYKVNYENKVILQSLSQEEIIKRIKSNFTKVWIVWYEFQFHYLNRARQKTGDLMNFLVFACVWYNKIINFTSKYPNNTGKQSLISKSFISNQITGINALSISEVLNMPRATVIRRLKYLEKFIFKDDNKLYHFRADKIKEFEKVQKETIKDLDNFCENIYEIIK
ncbi:hypothetical protein [Candidatus Pelagibacter sp.]|uniref:hypothetical protein n=1 Tax=Candidatus Pelagibacter sp. TaxID=2024849 RepID=UPI003D11BEC1